MFTGIIETLGTVTKLSQQNGNLLIELESQISKDLKIDQSVSHNGVCLTVVQMNSKSHSVQAIEETLQKTNLNELKLGDTINLERCMLANGRFDGHIVQGHVDAKIKCVELNDKGGSKIFTFKYPKEHSNLIVEKGSICINGVSLTCFDVDDSHFSVAIIPYTLENTTFKDLRVRSSANVEFDILGKYIAKIYGSK